MQTRERQQTINLDTLDGTVPRDQQPSSIKQHSESNPIALEEPTQPCCAPSWKRMLDWTCITLASPLLVPLALFLAALIKLGSPGPVLFVQERVGYRGRRFKFFKFRTMKIGADQELHRRHVTNLIRSNQPLTKMDSIGDSRLIPFGSILRTAGLDELPQIINVLRGDMSLVGPRPCLPYEFESYSRWQKNRFRGLPGLTGLWQVSGKNRTTFEEMIALDIFYLTNKSLWMDLKIIAQTIPAVMSYLWEIRHRPLSASRKAAGVKPSTRGTGRVWSGSYSPAIDVMARRQNDV